MLTNGVYILASLSALGIFAKAPFESGQGECLGRFEGICPKRIGAALRPRTDRLSRQREGGWQIPYHVFQRHEGSC
jgi:hypothetical protein